MFCVPNFCQNYGGLDGFPSCVAFVIHSACCFPIYVMRTETYLHSIKSKWDCIWISISNAQLCQLFIVLISFAVLITKRSLGPVMTLTCLFSWSLITMMRGEQVIFNIKNSPSRPPIIFWYPQLSCGFAICYPLIIFVCFVPLRSFKLSFVTTCIIPVPYSPLLVALYAPC